MLSWRLGGKDPLDGISVYDGGDYFHFVTFGFSELYEKESKDYEYSGYGFELTLKLKKSSLINKDDEIGCICGILQSLAKISYEDGVSSNLMNIYIQDKKQVWIHVLNLI